MRARALTEDEKEGDREETLLEIGSNASARASEGATVALGAEVVGDTDTEGRRTPSELLLLTLLPLLTALVVTTEVRRTTWEKARRTHAMTEATAAGEDQAMRLFLRDRAKLRRTTEIALRVSSKLSLADYTHIGTGGGREEEGACLLSRHARAAHEERRRNGVEPCAYQRQQCQKHNQLPDQ